MKDRYDYCILGAGLAGLSVAKNIQEMTGSTILILDPNGIGGGASGSPIGLVNPATGRYATKTWKANEAIHLAEKNFTEIAISTGKSFYKKTGVIRPAMDEKIALRMKENFDATSWKLEWCSWLDKKEMSQQFPSLVNFDGGLLVNEGFTVSIPDYLNALAIHLKKKDVDILEHENFELSHAAISTDSEQKEDKKWAIDVPSFNTSITAKTLVVTAGIKSTDFDFLKDLPLIPVKGQVVVFECEDEFPYQTAVSALGYFASLDGKTFVAGSTYEHKFDHEEPDDFGIEYISNRLFKVMPQLKGKIKMIDQWSGVRASTPDRMPIVGFHPDYENCFVFAGLGSKGLLYSSLIGKIIGSHFEDKNPIPEEVSIDRFSR